MNFRGASAGDVRKFTAPPKQAVCRFSGLGGGTKLFLTKIVVEQNLFGVEK